MSKNSQRRKRRQVNDVPLLVERVQKAEQGFEGGPRLTYEEARWPYLSPTFRAAHNRLRQARGLPTIPPPLVDLYVAPPKPLIRPFDPTDKEVIEAIAEAKRFDGPMMMGPPGYSEGFNGAALHPSIGRPSKPR
jgi:hypothetical protein